jgi:hypothetical protein
MKFQDLDLAKDYDGLRIQFNALKRIAISQQEQLQHYQKRVQEFSVERVIELEAELESQKEMNAMEYELEKLRKLQYYEWPLEDRMRYGRLQAMKQRRMDDWIRQTNKDIREEKV